MGTNTSQNIILENRKQLRISGVSDINSFTESKIVLKTALGELVIKGDTLGNVELKANGECVIFGDINSLTYTDFNENAGFFRRLFR